MVHLPRETENMKKGSQRGLPIKNHWRATKNPAVYPSPLRILICWAGLWCVLNFFKKALQLFVLHSPGEHHQRTQQT